MGIGTKSPLCAHNKRHNVHCAMRLRKQESHLLRKTGPRSTECGAGGTETQSGAVE